MQLSSEQQAIVSAVGARLQVIACAGSGKTEALAQRVARLLREDAEPCSILAFTFTNRAAESLKRRIGDRAAEIAGAELTRRLGPLYVGTIHGYCFRILQQHCGCENFDLLDEHRLAALLSREERRLDLRQRLGASRHWEAIKDFLFNAAVVENEMLDPAALPAPFGDCYRDYLEMLQRYRFLTFGQVICRAVRELRDPIVLEKVRSGLRHLIVDEYQDVNPAQEQLIQLLAAPPVSLCVVGDDDQAIYQWRGSEVANIVGFQQRHTGVITKPLSHNRRSTPEIIACAGGVSETIAGRLPKQMRPTRDGGGHVPQLWKAATAAEEAAAIAEHIERLRGAGFRYRDIAILLRSVTTSGPAITAALEERGIPYACAGRTGLFLQSEADLLGQVYAWLSGNAWRTERFGSQFRPVDLAAMVEALARRFGVAAPERKPLRAYLEQWRGDAANERVTANLVGDYYRLLALLGVDSWDLNQSKSAARMGTLARFSALLADFESVKRRARTVLENGAEVHRGGQPGGKWFYRQLFNYLQYYAQGAYQDFEGERDPLADAVDVTTVHQAKGLEWPVVFVPCLTDRRFPSSMSGRPPARWLLAADLVPEDLRARYCGSENDERRLFYVALTRAQDALYLSAFERTSARHAPSSRFLSDVAGAAGSPPLQLPPVGAADSAARPELAVSYSDLARYQECPYSYRLRSALGFQPQLAQELGYGRAVHNLLRRVAEQMRQSGQAPLPGQVHALVEQEFYLPYANRPAYDQLKRAATTLVASYLRDHGEDLRRVWETERPFELRLPQGVISGRADVILDSEGGTPGALALMDYKTTDADPALDAAYAFQLAIYAAAARDEGLDVRAAYLHHLDAKRGERTSIPVGGAQLVKARDKAGTLLRDLGQRKFPPAPEKKRCGRCDVQLVCRAAAG
ncbi:MAG: ATP-dependent helicase [Terriglobales bacterium]